MAPVGGVPIPCQITLMPKGPQGQKRKPKLTDEERHERFVDMAREVEASEDEKDFDKAFKKVAPKPKS
jgi:hypothetical protein